MALKIYDSLSGRVLDFEPLSAGKASLYVCGPTVYDLPHLGHGRSAVVFDVIRRYLKFLKYEVRFVSNYTDIDDKMIARAEEKGISVEQLAAEIIPEYELDYHRLAIIKPDVQPKATEYISQIIELISRLEKKGYVYVIENDGVYYDVKKFGDYGKLSRQNLADLQMGARVEVKEDKRNPYDFALWKFKKAGEPFWPSPWGEGRPGWHIECSAMSYGNLGECFDIHGGGLDLKFPHHECEIAQSEAVFGKNSFARYWIHNGFITINAEKMSKSLGNFFTLRDIFKRFDPLAVRFLFLQTHYRSPIDFSDKLLEQAEAGLRRIQDFATKISSHEGANDAENSDGVALNLTKFREDFKTAMDNDFNVPGALAVLFDLIKEINRLRDERGLGSRLKKDLLELLNEFDLVLGVIFSKTQIELTDEQMSLMEERKAARARRDFKRSDQIRDLLSAQGILLEDGDGGTIWKRK